MMINTLRRKLRGIPLVVILLTVFPFLISAYCIGSENNDNSSADTRYTCVSVPRRIVFCGDTVDLARYDRHERMDRELMAFSFMHSTSIQTIKRANRYFPVIVPILKENGIPEDFKYLMAIESACNPLARSGAGADIGLGRVDTGIFLRKSRDRHKTGKQGKNDHFSHNKSLLKNKYLLLFKEYSKYAARFCKPPAGRRPVKRVII